MKQRNYRRNHYTLDKQVPNTVIDLVGSNVLVGTTDSPDGKLVALRHIQDGLDILYAEGQIRITTDTFGGYRRSSFIGALLGTLPGVVATPPPVWLQLGGGGGGGADDSDSLDDRDSPNRGGYPDPETSAEIDVAGVEIALRAIEERFGGHEIVPMPHNNPGYDVAIRDADGVTIAYVEIKSTSAPEPVFFISGGELRFAEQHAERYHLIVVIDVDVVERTGNIRWRDGALHGDDVELQPCQWRGRLR